MNQQLEHYLRTYCCYEQTDWAEKLGMAEWTYNTSEHKSHGKSPAYLLLGYDPKGPTGIAHTEPGSEEAIERTTRIREDRKAAASLLEKSNQAHAKWYNKKRKPMDFEVGSEVLISAKHINQQRPSRKLADKYLGPFRITKRINGMAFEVKLPDQYKIHNTFPISHLEAYHRRNGEDPMEQDVQPEEDTIYEVERILRQRGKGQKTQYLIQWKGWTEEHNSWEPRANVGLEAIQEFEEGQRQKESQGQKFLN